VRGNTESGEQKDYDRDRAVEHKNLGNEHNRRGDVENAIREYTLAIQCDPTYAIAWLNRGSVRIGIGDYVNAKGDFEKVLECVPPDLEAYYKLGVVYKDGLASPEKAIENFEKAVEHDPSNRATAYSCLGEVYQKKGDFEKAEENYKKAIEERIENVAGVYYNLGVLYFKSDRFDDAIMAFSTATKHDPKNVDAYYYLGLVYFKIGRFEVASEKFSTVIDLDQKDVDAYYNRGLAYDALSGECEKGGSTWLSNLQKAKDDFQKVTELAPNRVKAHKNLGLAHLSLQDFYGAITAFDKAIDLNENDANAYYLRGMTYDNMGDIDKINRNYGNARKNYDNATRDYKKAIGIDPNIREAQDALAEVGNKCISLPGIGS